MTETQNKSAMGQQQSTAGTLMTIQERPSFLCTADNNSANAGSSAAPWFGAAFGRSFGFGGEIDDQNARISNCVCANWPLARQKMKEIIGDEESRIFVTITSMANRKTVQLQLEQDFAIERRTLSMPAHILRWCGFEPDDEVSVELNTNLCRGFSPEIENLPAASLAISRIQLQVQLTELRQFSKLSLCADSLADYFRRTFLHDVLNVGQCCLLEFECATKSEQQQNGRKRKYVEMRENMTTENYLMPPQPKKGLAASAVNALLNWYGFEGGTKQRIKRKFTIEAKVIVLYRSQIASDTNAAQYGLVKEATQIVFSPIAESGLHLYGDPSMIYLSLVPSTATNAKTTITIENNDGKTKLNQNGQNVNSTAGNINAATGGGNGQKINENVGQTSNKSLGQTQQKVQQVTLNINSAAGGNNRGHNNGNGKNAAATTTKENGVKNAAANDVVKSVKLIVKQFDIGMRCTYKNDDACLVCQEDYNVLTKKISEQPVSSSTGLTPLMNSYTIRSEIIIKYKIQEDNNVDKLKENSTLTLKERQFLCTAINQTDYAIKGEKGIIFLTQGIMDQMNLETGDEVTIEALDGKQCTAKKIKMEFKSCDGSAKCARILGYRHTNNSTFFHANDIVNSFIKNYSQKNVNSNFIGNLSVNDEEIKKRMKSFKTNLFDSEATNNQSACIQFQITEIHASNNEEKTNSTNNSENSTTNSTTTAEVLIENADFATIKKDTTIEIKCIDPTLTIFGLKEDQMVNVKPKLFDKNSWNLHKKVGGLDEQLGEIFRRTFASRMIPAECSKQMGIKHIRGILLHGPPGTGKTLIARELAKELNSREPKVINGAEVQSMWFGQSEKNVRSLFVDAEKEQALAGDQSRLHVIIIDELDALCPNRQNTATGHRTEQRIVNTLLAKLDGVEQLDNILLIGMTNLMETIDSALLRPGRLELKLHIGLPNEKGRREILDIHTKTMREANRLHEDVDLEELAKKTVNFSGAELEGLVRAAQSQAIQRIIKAQEQQMEQNKENANGSMASTENSFLNDSEELKICAADFELAFENDIEPALGKGSMDSGNLKAILCREPILWSAKIEKLLQKGVNLVEELRASNIETVGHSRLMLLNGPRQSGKTFLATTIAQRAEIPYIRIVTADSVLKSEKGPSALFDKILADCENTDLACIIFDNVEQIIGYNECNQSWNQAILQKLAIILEREPSKEKRLLLLATSAEKPEWFEQMRLHCCLQNRMELPAIAKCEDLMGVFGAATKKAAENAGETKSAEKLFSKCEIGAIAKEIGPELSGGKWKPTIKDLVKLIDWYSNQNLETTADSSAQSSTTAAEEESQQEKLTADSNKTLPSAAFQKFKQRLLQLIAQQKYGGGGFHSTSAHLSMYR